MMAAGKQPDNLDTYLVLDNKDIVRLVLMLLIEEGLKERLAEFRERENDSKEDKAA